jgi:hypothetical protein
MVRKSIDPDPSSNSVMDLMYNIRTNDESITCYDNISNSLTDITYIPPKKKKSKSSTTTTSDNNDNDDSGDE